MVPDSASSPSLPTRMTEIVVCTTCRSPHTAREMPADGLQLLEAVEAAALMADSGLAAGSAIRVRGQACMSGRSRGCVVAFQATGKHTYLIGDLRASAETAADVVHCARLHLSHSDGSMAWGDRPERLRRGILAKVPPVATMVEGAPV